MEVAHMSAQITNYQCPACTGPLHFSAESGKLECDYCGSSYTAEEIDALYAAENEENASAEEMPEGFYESVEGDYATQEGAWGEDGEKVRVYSCPSCCAELICDETTAATSCPYCGNPTVVPAQLSGILKPDFVLPFKVKKEDAIAAIRAHYKGKKLLPKSFAAGNHIEEVKGVYVPFWLYDGTVDADIAYRTSRSHSFTRGNVRITNTDHFYVRRAGTVEFDRIPADASTKMPDEYMDAIEPFDYSELKPFSLSYLPGYMADKYDVTADICAQRADDRARQSAREFLQSSVIGYTTCIPYAENIRVKRGNAQYALLPVWLLTTRWQNKTFLFAMNGQTGKMVSNLPVSMGKFFAWFAGIAAPIAALLAAWQFLL